MNKSNWLTIVISVLVGLFAIIFGTRRCNSDHDNNETIENIEEVVVGKQFIDSLRLVNSDLQRANDSLTVELAITLLNMPEDKETQVVTQVVTKYVYLDTMQAVEGEQLTLNEQLDSIQNELNLTVEYLEQTKEMEEQRYQQLLSEKLEAAAKIPCVINHDDNYLTIEATCINAGVKSLSVVARDSLTTTHTTSRKWFLGRKSYHVYISNANPHVELSGTAYVIDKKLRRKARRNKNKS